MIGFLAIGKHDIRASFVTLPGSHMLSSLVQEYREIIMLEGMGVIKYRLDCRQKKTCMHKTRIERRKHDPRKPV